MLQQDFLDYCQKETIWGLIHNNENKSAMRGAQLIPIRIPTKCLYNVEPYPINILNKSENATPELFAIYIDNYGNQ